MGFSTSLTIKQLSKIKFEEIEKLNWTILNDVIEGLSEKKDLIDLLNMVKYNLDNQPIEYTYLLVTHFISTILDYADITGDTYSTDILYSKLTLQKYFEVLE